MSNNDWYSSPSDWYVTEGLEKELSSAATRGGGKKRRWNWTRSRLVGMVCLLLVLITASSLIFADRRSPGEEQLPPQGEVWSFEDFGEFDTELPEDWDEFFESYYSPADTVTSDIRIPRIELDDPQPLKLEPSSGEELSLQELYSRCSQSIVAIYGYVDGEEGYYWGSGVILSEDGLVLTNTHIIEGCDRAVVKLHDNSEYDAMLVGGDAVSDVALLKIDAKDLAAASFGESSSLTVGDRVAAIGNPLGEEFRMTLTDGIISAIERGISYKGQSMMLLQTNTALNEGNSGGALFNMYGQVIGITNMKMMSTYSSIEGIGFAIPTATVRTVVNSLIRFGEVRGRPSLGLTVGAIPESAAEHYTLPGGLYVSGIQPGCDAEKQGVQIGDIITQVNYQDVSSTEEVSAIKNSLEVGDIMILTIWRDGETLEIEVILMDTNDVY